jgi:hypothetical protein
MPLLLAGITLTIIFILTFMFCILTVLLEYEELPRIIFSLNMNYWRLAHVAK